MEGILLVAVVTAVLYGLWTLLAFSFDLIDQWHARARESAEAESAIKEKDGSRFS